MLLNRIRTASLVVGVCLALSACGGPAEDREAAAGTPAATAPVAPARDTPEAESARPRVVVLGDSLTAGLGLLETQSFPALLQQKIDEEGYQFDVDWEGTNVEFVSLEHLENGGLTLCPQTVQLSPQRILGACAQPQLVSTDYTGQLSLLTFRCTTPGETTLQLRYQEGSFGTKIETVTPEIETSHTLELSDATVTCA